MALRLKPDSIEAHYNLGKTLETMPGRINDAVAEFGEALRIEPDSAMIHFNLAIALLKSSGRRDEAEAQLEAVLRLQPENDTARQILARIRLSRP
jgi:cytochrome c-type biogenesis protein CcmH/NrfG